MEHRALNERRLHPRFPNGGTGRIALASVLGFVVFGVALWIGCAEEPVRPSAPPFQPNYFLESVSASPGQIGVGGATSVVSVSVVDREGDPAPGVSVTLDAEEWGTISPEATTDSTGLAEAIFTSGSREGLAKVTARVEAFSKSTMILIGQGSLEASPAILLANGVETSTITARVISTAGQPDSGTVVSFNTTAGSITPLAVTDAAGVVKATLTSAASVEDIAAVITARVETGVPEEEEKEPFGLTLVTMKGITLGVEASPSSIPADGSTQASVTASLKETASLVPLANEVVRFSTNRGVAVGEMETDERGHAVSQLTSSLEPGTAQVIASYGNTISDTVEVVFSSLSLELTPMPATVRGDGVSRVEVGAVLKDLTGETLAGRVVGFTADIGTISAQDTTTSSGLAIALFTAPATTKDTTATITATALGVSGTLEIPVQGLSLSVATDPAVLVADGSSQAEVTVTLVETTSGEPLPSQAVRISTNLGAVDSVAITNSAGVATATFHGGSNTGTATIEVHYGVGLITTKPVEIVPAEVASVNLSCLPGAIFADGFNKADVRAVVKDSGNRSVPDGMIVKFSTSAGLITPHSTTVGGVAAATLTSGTDVQSDVRVTATCQDVSDTTYVDFVPGVPATMALTVAPDSIPADGTTTASLIATVQDSIGHPVEDGTLVVFRIILGLADTTAADTVDVSSPTSNGVASTSYTAATRAGLAVITATAGEVADQATLVLTASEVASIVITTNRSSITVKGVGGVETATVTAEARDKNGNPVAEGTWVWFSIINGPGGANEENLNSQGWGPVAIPTANGRASVTLNAGTKSGVVGISATCGDIEARDAEITIDSGPPDTLAVAANFGLVAEGGDGTYDVIVSAVVKDGYGNPVEDGSAVFFDLDPKPAETMIEGNAFTGNEVDCNQTWPTPTTKGVARTCLTYTSEDIFETVGIRARAFSGSGEITTSKAYVLPIISGELLISAFPTYLDSTSTSTVTVGLMDKYDNWVDGGVIDFSTEEGDGLLNPAWAITDENGMASSTLSVAPGVTNGGKINVIARLRATTVEATLEIPVR